MRCVRERSGPSPAEHPPTKAVRRPGGDTAPKYAVGDRVTRPRLLEHVLVDKAAATAVWVGAKYLTIEGSSQLAGGPRGADAHDPSLPMYVQCMSNAHGAIDGKLHGSSVSRVVQAERLESCNKRRTDSDCEGPGTMFMYNVQWPPG